MQGRFHKELWTMRFQRMLDLELRAAETYEFLLEECKQKEEEMSVQEELAKLVADEKKHAKLVQQLLEIVAKQAE